MQAGARDAQPFSMPILLMDSMKRRSIIRAHANDCSTVNGVLVQQRWMGTVERCRSKAKAGWDVEGSFVATDAEEWKEGFRPCAGTPWHGVSDLQL